MINPFFKTILQSALNSRDIKAINSLMPKLFNDYNQSYAQTLIDYNETCDIKAADLISYKRNNPQGSFLALFMFEEQFVKTMCNTNMREYFAIRSA